ncbi:GDSL-type esterase/lipase family protein [Microbacterium schleiferi]|uniref:GDSL-type esterase/lipase family protein n=1 Tax=Microbacterium schleiferi TaxID=69362 RepID=A0ABU7V2K0_9MICO|nr:lipase [Micrococcales bacterium]
MSAAIHRYTFPAPEAPVVGALDLEPGALGVHPRRLPAWTRRQIPDRVFDFVVGMGSGLRIATATAATQIDLEFAVIGIDPAVGATVPATVQLVVDGVVAGTRVFGLDVQTLVDGTGEITQRHGPVHARFDGLGAGWKAVEVWLPHSTAMELISIAADEPLHPPADDRPVWVHHGSSISQCGEALAPTLTWPAVAAAAGGVRLHSLGFSGNAVGDPFVARTIRDLPADLISVEIGINVVNGDLMRRRMFESVLHGFLDTVRDGHPETELLVLGPIPCPAHENAPGPTIMDPLTGQCASAGSVSELTRGALSLEGVRDAIGAVLRARDDDPHLHYLDGRVLLSEAETADLPDGLHPSADAYVRMGRRFADAAFAPGTALDPRRDALAQGRP